MKKLIALVMFITACTTADYQTDPVDSDHPSDVVTVPPELRPQQPNDQSCQAKCFGSWSCGGTCRFCTAGTNGGQGKCITAEAIKPGDIVLE